MERIQWLSSGLPLSPDNDDNHDDDDDNHNHNHNNNNHNNNNHKHKHNKHNKHNKHSNNNNNHNHNHKHNKHNKHSNNNNHHDSQKIIIEKFPQISFTFSLRSRFRCSALLKSPKKIWNSLKFPCFGNVCKSARQCNFSKRFES